MIEEIWKPIDGFDGYEVSNLGRVRSWRTRGHEHTRLKVPNIRKPFLTRHHLQVGLNRNKVQINQSIHVLVLEAFIGKRPPGMFACHNNGNALDNRLENLRWDTPSSNQLDRAKHNTDCRGERNTKAKLSRHDVLAIRKDLRRQKVITQQYNVTQALISSIKTRKNWAWL